MMKRKIDVSGPDGSAFFLLSQAKQFAIDLGMDVHKIEAEMISGDYEDLLNVFEGYFSEYIEVVR